VRIFVTGATGVLGRSAVRELVAIGYDVTGVARTQERASIVTAAGARAVVVDLFDGAALSKAMAGHDVVCNLATSIPSGMRMARAAAWRENDLIRARGSEIVAEAARVAGAQRLVQEAITLVDADGGAEWIDERHRIEPLPPTRSSLTATENALRFGVDGRFAVVLRFGLCYGDDALTRYQLDRVRRGRPVLTGDPEGYVPLLHLRDAGAAVAAAVGSPSGIYNVAGEPINRADLAELLGKVTGGAAPAKYVPPLLQRAMGWRARLVGRSQRVSSSAFYTATGWRPKVPVSEGWPSTS
jgi:nucleoside-diphosphate-sugar epimerase